MFRYTANGNFIMRENFSQYTELSLDEFRQRRAERKIRLSINPIKNKCLSFTEPQKCSSWNVNKTCDTDEFGFEKCNLNPECVQPNEKDMAKIGLKTSCMEEGPKCFQLCDINAATKRRECIQTEYNKGRCCPLNTTDVVKYNNKFYCVNE
jgi:hypothetical protein